MKRVVVPTEPTEELVEAACKGLGFTPKWTRTILEAVREKRGTASEPGILPELRAVLAVLNGVPLSDIKRGYKGK